MSGGVTQGFAKKAASAAGEAARKRIDIKYAARKYYEWSRYEEQIREQYAEQQRKQKVLDRIELERRLNSDGMRWVNNPLKMAAFCCICLFVSGIANVENARRNNRAEFDAWAARADAAVISWIKRAIPMPSLPWGERDAATTQDERVAAFLDLIAWAEGADYDVIVGGSRITDYSDHPRQRVAIASIGNVSTAAGRFQITDETFDDFASRAGVSDFSPSSQDKVAIALLESLDIPEKLARGDIDGAIVAAGRRWAPFPGSLGAGQRQYSTAELRAKYEEFLRQRSGSGGDRIFPLAGRTMDGDTTSPFGWRLGGGKRSPTERNFHNGHDLACNIGEPMLAVEAGRVEHFQDMAGFGPYGVRLVAENGGVWIYGHADQHLVSDGQRVKAGTPVASCGTRGNSSGPHLHIEYTPPGESTAIDPAPILRQIERQAGLD